MKIQCTCGAKFSFEVTPESAANPVQFICPNCGLDSSDLMNDLIRRELDRLGGSRQPEEGTPPKEPTQLVVKRSRMRVSRSTTPDAGALKPEDGTGAVADPPAVVYCAKHPGEPVAEKCAVCHKPICPQCLALFGFFCSPFCKSKAAAENLQVPVYQNLASAVEARFWRKVGRIFAALVTLVVLVIGGGLWYVFYAAQPHAVFSQSFDPPASAGHGRRVGLDQLLVLHGGTLARCDVKTQTTVWSHEVIASKTVDALAARLAERQGDRLYKQSGPQLQQLARKIVEAQLSLLGAGSNVWLADATRLVHYDWATGRELQSLPLGGDQGAVTTGDGELLVMREAATGAKFVTHINFADGTGRTEEFHETGKLTLVTGTDQPGGSGLPSATGTPGQPLDPSTVAEQARNLTTPARMALPAVLANNAHQQQLMEEMREDDAPKPKPSASPTAPPAEAFQLVPGTRGLVQYSVKLLEQHLVKRAAMKAPAGKSVINGDLTASQGTEVANETLNEMQRANGGDQVTEDESRYQVTVRRPGAAETPDWTGEVVGPPVVYALKTVNVLTAGKSVTVLDQANNKQWTAALTYNVAPSRRGLNGEASPFGAGPCVEQGDTLFVVDQAVLTAFDLATGNARWRLPSVGIVGLFPDDQGMLYVNTTTANPDKIKYSRQIDVAESIDSILLKVDARTGRNLWTAKTGGFASYVSGPFVYTLQSHDVQEDERTGDLTAVLQRSPFMKIFRLDPKNGHTLWEYDDAHAPLDVWFDKNVIGVVFHTRVEVLKYFAL
jgi:hypothetical protein